MMRFIFIIVPISQQRKLYRFLFLLRFFLGWLGTCLSTLLIRGRCSYLSFLFKRLYSPDDELSRIIYSLRYLESFKVMLSKDLVGPPVLRVKLPSPPQTHAVNMAAVCQWRKYTGHARLRKFK